MGLGFRIRSLAVCRDRGVSEVGYPKYLKYVRLGVPQNWVP